LFTRLHKKISTSLRLRNRKKKKKKKRRRRRRRTERSSSRRRKRRRKRRRQQGGGREEGAVGGGAGWGTQKTDRCRGTREGQLRFGESNRWTNQTQIIKRAELESRRVEKARLAEDEDGDVRGVEVELNRV